MLCISRISACRVEASSHSAEGARIPTVSSLGERNGSADVASHSGGRYWLDLVRRIKAAQQLAAKPALLLKPVEARQYLHHELGTWVAAGGALLSYDAPDPVGGERRRR